MTLKDQISADESLFLNDDDFAEAAVYNGEDIFVIEAEASEQSTGAPGFIAPVYSVLVSANDVTRPKAGDVVTFRGVQCTVGPFPLSDGGFWRVELLKDTIQV